MCGWQTVFCRRCCVVHSGGGEPLRLATHLALQGGEFHILILPAIENHDVCRQINQRLTPGSSIIRGEGAVLPLLTNSGSTCFQDAAWIIPVSAHPPRSRCKRLSEDALLQPPPGKTIDRFHPIPAP